MIPNRPENAAERADLRLILGPNKGPICDAYSDGACGLTLFDWAEPFQYPDDPAFIAIFRDGPEDGREAGRGPLGFQWNPALFVAFEAHRVAIISTRDTWSGVREAAVYQEAAAAARNGEIVIIIETDPAQGPVWNEMFELLPPPIKPHWVRPLVDGGDVA